MKKLAIVTTHPIQYYAPVFKLISERKKIQIKAFYTWGTDSLKPKFDPGFGKEIEWDIPLLVGYDYEFLENISENPGSSHFSGIKNPDAISKLTSFNPDAILVYGWSNQSHLKILRYFKRKIPVWFRGDSNLIDDKYGWKSHLRNIFLSWVYKHVDKAFYVGTANKAYFKKYGLKDHQLVFAPHAIDNLRFQADRLDEVHIFRDSLGVNSEDILILFAGKFEPKKNPGLLLNAFSKLEQENVHLLFVGDGILENDLKEMTKEVPSKARIHFLAFQNQQNMPVVYQACDLYCLPSNGPGETWGLAVNEAMAAGKPILATSKVGCAQDLVSHGKNGYIIRPNSIDDVYHRLLIICKDKSALSKMGKESQKIIDDWSFIKQAEAFENALNS